MVAGGSGGSNWRRSGARETMARGGKRRGEGGGSDFTSFSRRGSTVAAGIEDGREAVVLCFVEIRDCGTGFAEKVPCNTAGAGTQAVRQQEGLAKSWAHGSWCLTSKTGEGGAAGSRKATMLCSASVPGWRRHWMWEQPLPSTTPASNFRRTEARW